MLNYRVRHAGWIVFRSVYWAMYLMMLGVLLLFYGFQQVSVSLQVFAGWALALFAVMIIIYGAVEMLHNKLMRKYG